MFSSGVILLIGSWDRGKAWHESTTREATELARCLDALSASERRCQAAGQLVYVIEIFLLRIYGLR